MNANKDEPTQQENEFANRNHESKLQPMDLKLKSARCGQMTDKLFVVKAFDDVSESNINIAAFSILQLGVERARFLAERLTLQINNGEL